MTPSSLPTRRDDESLDALVDADLAEQLKGHDLTLTFGNLFVTLLVAATFGKTAPKAWVLGWLALQLANAAVQLVSGLSLARRRLTAADAPAVMRRATRISIISGALWLAGIQLFWPGSSDWQRMLLACWMIGTVMTMLHALHAHLPAFFSFFGLCAGGVVIAVASNRTAGASSILISVALFVVLNVRFAMSLNRLLVQSLRRQHEISAMADKLNIEKDRAVSLSQSRSRFLAAASHDLRQPVHALSLFVGALSQDPPPDQARRILRHVGTAVDAMATMFNALLDVSKLDADMLEPDIRRVHLQALLERIAADETPHAEAAGLALRCDTRGLADVCVLTDAVLLERILRNLLSNAIRYTDDGTVSLRGRVARGEACVTIADTGRGIPGDRQKEAFEEFVQLHNPERDREKGLGLGLSIVQRLVNLLQLRLRMRSAPGRGTAFVLRLPLARRDVVAVPMESLATAGAPLAASLALERGDVVIVIDDNLEIQVAMSALVTSWGCRVFCAADVEELMPRLMHLDRAPRVLVCDYRLRDGQTGLSMIAQLQAAFNEDIPAVIVTGDTAPERLREAVASGWPLLHKPVTQAQLREAVATALAIDSERQGVERA